MMNKIEMKKMTLEEMIKNEIILMNKPIGITPLQIIQLLKKKKKFLQNIKMSYAGRLDPMARGLLIILLGNQLKIQKKMELTIKEYQFDILFGLQTDTYDILGLCPEDKFEIPKIKKEYLKEQLEKIKFNFIGKMNQTYPPYSSCRINGKHLFQWAKEGKLDQITIPSIEIEIFSLELVNIYEIEINNLKNIIFEKIQKVTTGDFRQDLICNRWKFILEHEKNQNKTLFIATFIANVSPGTYIRSISHNIGKNIFISNHCDEIGALAFDIFRTKIENYHIEQAYSIEEL